MKLYYCASRRQNEEGDPIDYDLFVIANSFEEAAVLWLAHWRAHDIAHIEMDPDEDPEGYQTLGPDAKPDQTFEVPIEQLLSKTPRAIGWDLLTRQDT